MTHRLYGSSISSQNLFSTATRTQHVAIGTHAPETVSATGACSLLSAVSYAETTTAGAPITITVPTPTAANAQTTFLVGMLKTICMTGGADPITINAPGLVATLSNAQESCTLMWTLANAWIVTSNTAGGGVVSGTEYSADFDSSPSYIQQTDPLNVPTGIDFNLTAMSSSGGEGGILNLASGSSTFAGGGSGGALNINAGTSAKGNGGAVNITGGTAGDVGTDAGGSVSILAGSSSSVGTTGDGGSSSLRAGNSYGSIGGVATLRAGNSENSDGGAVFIQSGSSTTATGSGGNINLYAGNTQTGGVAGGTVDIYGGYAIVDGQGGNVNMYGGESTSAGRGGHVSMRAGASLAAIGEAANATVRGGNVSSPDTTPSGHVALIPGFNSSVATQGHRRSGSIFIDATSASAAAGAHLVAVQSLLPWPDSGTVSARSSDMAGTWTGAAVDTVTIGFIVAYAHAPHVVVSATHGVGSFVSYAVTDTDFTVTSSLADITALTWICVGGSIA